ncbi:hypothetical protein [Paraburkholderia sp.]|uniref:hypothetical protein n=1 Tax=Paraburkholderia sp. TaxID=1926495 RepID=UPI0023832FAE|nr:hypothetical protein [Paraburkholderia sp.]MDE1181552.1 hypothetical protein [Paraburkholderia sp.]
MNQPSLTPSVAQFERISLAAVDAGFRYASQLGDLSALAQTLQSAVTLNPEATDAQHKLAQLLARLADEYQASAQIEAEMFSIVVDDARGLRKKKKKKRGVTRQARQARTETVTQ